MRKDLELEMDAAIRLEYDAADERIADLVSRHADLIAEEVRADEASAVSDGHRKTWEVEGTELEIAIEEREADRQEASERASGD